MTRMKGLVRLAYTKRIDASAQQPWDKLVFEETHQEFFMQAQRFDQDGRYPTLRALLDHIPQAEQIHYLTSRVAMGYLQQLNQIVPDVLNASGQSTLPFTQFKFEILASHIERKEEHKIAIHFYSDPLTWLDTIGTNLLVAYGDQWAALQQGSEIMTDLIPLQPMLNIWSFQPLV